MFLRFAVPFMLLSAAATAGLAGDWPQILGPHRDGVAQDETLLTNWPEPGPATLWSYDVGEGYAGAAVVADRAIVFHRVGDIERVEALAVEDGRSLWKADFEASYGGGINSDLGPRCVPVIHGQFVLVYGAGGDVHCVKLATGEKVWSRQLHTDFQAPDGYFGAGSTPIAWQNSLLVNVGARQAGIVALAIDTGKTLWQATDDRASYSSPTAWKHGDRVDVVFVTRLHAVGLAPRTGEELFRSPFGASGPTVNAATPVIVDDHLFLTASYGIGARWVKLGETPKPVWMDSKDSILSSQYTTPVYHDGYFYGIHGREDYAGAQLRCIHAENGSVKWTQEDFGVAHLILADKKLLIAKVDGDLLLAEPNPEKFQTLDHARVAVGTTRAIPALANGRLFVRVSGQDAKLVCLQVGKIRDADR